MQNRIVNHLDTELSGYQVFADSKTQSETRKALRTSLGLYPGRALCITKPGDVLYLSSTLRAGWDWIGRHYQRIGLQCTDEVVWDSQLRLLGGVPTSHLSVFMFSHEIHDICPDEKWLDIVRLTNSKNEFIGLCQSLGVQTPRTACFFSKRQARDLSGFSFPVFLKADQSVSGLGVVKCSNRDELEQAIESLDENEQFQVQEAVSAKYFLNLQYQVENNGLEKVACTQQILTGYTHAGNVFPARSAPWSATEKIATFMTQKGMKGIFGFDIAMCKDGPYVIECNPRYNGSTYPTISADKLLVREWSAQTYSTSLRSLNDLSLEETEYCLVRKTGVVVVNWGAVEQGKLGILIAGNPQQRKEIEGRLTKLLVPSN